MLPHYVVCLVALERIRDLWREAEKDRLVRLALAGQQQREPLVFQALAWLGRRLVIWGHDLQKRGGFEIDAPVLPPVNQCQHC